MPDRPCRFAVFTANVLYLLDPPPSRFLVELGPPADRCQLPALFPVLEDDRLPTVLHVN